jgi:glycosyltransferase involved in cell wall biosynthesis
VKYLSLYFTMNVKITENFAEIIDLQSKNLDFRVYRNTLASIITRMRASILIPTYARVEHLQEALFSCLNQDYHDLEIVILNDCPEQTIEFDHPKVRVINQKVWTPIIGDKRNKLIDLASGEIMIALDDDDLLKSNHVSEHVKNILENDVAASIGSTCLYWERRTNLRKIGHASINLAFRKSANIRYPSREIDYDIKLIEKIWKNNFYRNLHLEKPTYVYCWDNNSFHISGTGVIANFMNNAKERFISGQEPIGKITLKPQIKPDAAQILGSTRV